jgi:diguanylate cyclase (GGDEF)-like protein
MRIEHSIPRVHASRVKPILLVEPDETARRRWASWLVGRGCPQVAPSGPAEALELLRGNEVSLVLVNASAGGDWAVGQLRSAMGIGHGAMVAFGSDLGGAARARLRRQGADEMLDTDVPCEEAADRLRSMLETWLLREELGRCRSHFRKSLVRERRVARRLRRHNRRLAELALTDALTGLSNLRFFRQWLETQFEIARRHSLVLSLLTIDIDKFKRLNDGGGHPFGDYVLNGFAEILRQQARASDVVARVGGDEFVVGLVETDRASALRFGRRLLRAVASNSFECFGKVETITVSIGLATFPQDAQITSPQTLVLFADQALYQAKNSGRNNIVCWQDLDPAMRKRLAHSEPAASPLQLGQPALCVTGEGL